MPQLSTPLPVTSSPPFTHLIIVCCHATYLGFPSPPSASLSESAWSLQSFQRSKPSTHKPSELHTFLSHIHAGIALASSSSHPNDSPRGGGGEKEEKSLLVFSGGQTTPTHPSNPESRSEAESYAILMRTHLSTSSSNEDSLFYATETAATDSYQNLLFSLLLFHSLTHFHPERITVITHAFKTHRFLSFHGPAVKFPPERLRVLGINPPFTVQEAEETEKGEREKGVREWERDLYGVGEVLGGKRRARGWKGHEELRWFDGLEGEVKALLEWRGGESGREIFPGRLPWEGN